MTPPSRHAVDLTAFVAWVVSLMILIMAGHVSGELLTAVTASVGSVLSLWNRGSGPHPAK